MTVDDILDRELGVEGGYTNNPDDAGGETNWGITVRTARANGYAGAMLDMPRSEALRILKLEYVYAPGFDHVYERAGALGGELIDIGINMGPVTASMWLQRGLNALNHQQADYPDIAVDGQVGPGTLRALDAYLGKRGTEGAGVLAEVVRCLRGADYIRQCEGRPQNETFVYGWFKNRVMGA